MFRQSFRLFAIALLVFTSACSSRIYLRDGSVLNGYAVDSNEHEVSVSTRGDLEPELRIPREEILDIELGQRPRIRGGATLLGIGALSSVGLVLTQAFHDLECTRGGCPLHLLPVTSLFVIAGSFMLGRGLQLRGREAHHWERGPSFEVRMSPLDVNLQLRW